jgi:small subunit ribosomal protein S6
LLLINSQRPEGGKNMKRYEIMYIIRPNLEDGVRNALIAELNKILTDYKSEDLKVNEWGIKDLAYEIKDYKKGYYIVLDVMTNVDAINELDRVMKIRENVIRHIVIARDEK